MTHVARKDLWWQKLAELFRALLWFNPVVHIAWKSFRHDQELACDHDVLAKSNQNERYEYGLALLKGLHAHALPSMMAFFNGHKQRFILLERHKPSKINMISGIFICALLLAFSLIKAPKSIASEQEERTSKKGLVSYHLENTSLKTIAQLLMNAEQKDIVGLTLIPDMKVSIDAKNVKASSIMNLIIKCSGLNLIHRGGVFEIVKLDAQNNEGINADECVESFKS